MSTRIHDEIQTLLPRLWRFCLSLTSQRASAEDLLQSCCLRMLERHDQYQSGTRFDAWAFRITKNLWFNELRSQRVRQGQGFGTESVEELASSDGNPESIVFRAEVFKAVMNLPEAQRVAMILVYVEGFTYAEVAEVLEVPLGTIMSRLAAGRRTLTALRVEPAPQRLTRQTHRGDSQSAETITSTDVPLATGRTNGSAPLS